MSDDELPSMSDEKKTTKSKKKMKSGGFQSFGKF